MRYIGIDLAWGTRSTTAAVVLTGDTTGVAYHAHVDALTNNEAIMDFVQTHGGEPGAGLLVAIDAPTLVLNATGRRPCEAFLSRHLRKQEAGAHPANRTLLSDENGEVRGEALVALLETRLAITHTPHFDRLGLAPRAAFEVFPHPAHIALFGIEKTLKYKKKPGRDRDYRNEEFRRYIAFLLALNAADPPLNVPPDFLPDPITFVTEAALKRYEDRLDALTCAYVAAYHHRHHADRSIVIGDMETGYIVTPATDALREALTQERG